MRTSGDPRRGRGASAGFTLLEIMMTVFLLGVVILSILGVRETATNRAFRSKNQMLALHHAQELLADHARDLDQLDRFEGRIEDATDFHYELTLEDWDLSTGRAEDDEEDDAFDDPSGALAPADAGAYEEQAIDDPHRVRRFRVKVFYPHVTEEDSEEFVLLEGFLPRMYDKDRDPLGTGQASSANPR